MTRRRVIARPSTPLDAVTTTGAGRELPPDLLRQACRRVGIVALVAAFIWAASLIINQVLFPLIGRSPDDMHVGHRVQDMRVLAIGFVVFSLAVYFYTRVNRRGPVFLLNLGLFTEIANAAAIGYINHQMFPMPGDMHGVSWIAPLVLIYPALVPTMPRYTAVAAFTSALMDPITYLWAVGTTQGSGAVVGEIPFAILGHFSNFLCAIVAVIISRVVTGLGQQVTKARELGSYELSELLGSGGMGEVWKATHRLLARPAAIKLIRPEKLGAVDQQGATLLQHRFKREAQAAATLRSPHTIELFDFGVTGEGTFYYVMELLDGLDLDQLVRRFGPVPPERAVHILRQVCDSLGEAHELGLVHRDIKPANVYLCRMGLRHDYAKVLDFGLVKVNRQAREQTLLTAPEVTAGTPAFMPPEIALGEAVDGRADIYALGCVAYWLVSGNLVFDAETPLQMAAKHVQSTPPPPSARTELPVPAELDRVILWCLEKDPARRPATATALAEALDASLNGRTWPDAAAVEWWRTHLPQAGLRH